MLEPMSVRKSAVGGQGLMICVISVSVYGLTTVHFSVLRDFHLYFHLDRRRVEDTEGCCGFKRERERESVFECV